LYQKALLQQSKPVNQLPITDFTHADAADISDNSSHYASTNSRQKLFTASLVENLIVGCGLPISVVSSDFFKQFITDIDPKYQIPCRQTISYTLIPKQVDVKKNVLKDKLSTCSSVALTADIWTDRRCHSYLGVTVHSFVKGQPFTHLLAFKTFRGSHTGQRIAEAMDEIVNEYAIKDKVNFIITDNASNMLKAMSLFFPLAPVSADEADDNPAAEVAAEIDDTQVWEDLTEGEILEAVGGMGERLACFCHSLQLVVRSGLDKITCRTAMAKVSKLANMVHQSALFRAEFEQTFDDSTRIKSIPATNDTRWNSVYRYVWQCCFPCFIPLRMFYTCHKSQCCRFIHCNCMDLLT
jgi:hypothetical protein